MGAPEIRFPLAAGTTAWLLVIIAALRADEAQSGAEALPARAVPVPLKHDDAGAQPQCIVNPQRNCPTLTPLDVFPNSTWQQCCRRCAAHAGCAAWTLDGVNGDHPGHCFLNKDCKHVMKTMPNGSSSGVMKGAFPVIPKECGDFRTCAACHNATNNGKSGAAPCVFVSGPYEGSNICESHRSLGLPFAVA